GEGRQRVDVPEERRPDEVAAAGRVLLVAGRLDEGGALAGGTLDVAAELLDLGRVGQRAEGHAVVEAVADPGRAGHLGDPRDELVRDGLVDDDPRGPGAGLPRESEGALGDDRRRAAEVGSVE